MTTTTQDYGKQAQNDKKLAKEVQQAVEDDSVEFSQARRNTKHLDQLEEEGYQ